MEAMHHIVVAGDVFIDHHVYAGDRLTASATKHRGFRVVQEPGGAVGLKHLIREVHGEVGKQLPEGFPAHRLEKSS